MVTRTLSRRAILSHLLAFAIGVILTVMIAWVWSANLRASVADIEHQKLEVEGRELTLQRENLQLKIDLTNAVKRGVMLEANLILCRCETPRAILKP